MAIFFEIGRNTFTVTFNIDADKQGIMEGRPWQFDNNLYVLKQLEGRAQTSFMLFNTIFLGANV